MYDPELYYKMSGMQKDGSKIILDEFFDYLKIRPDGKDSVIDIGCGTANVFMDLVYPKLPKTCTKIVGIDISVPMVENSTKKYSWKHENISFKVLDITTENLPIEYREQFDHVMSFYCLHWEKNHKQAFSNIYDMMADNGDCLIAFVSDCVIFNHLQTLASNPKWMEYMKDMIAFVPNTQNSTNVYQKYTKLLEALRFRDIRMELKDFARLFKGRKTFEETIQSINPFISRIPLSKQAEFMKDLIDCFEPVKDSDENFDPNEINYRFEYQMLIVCGKK